VRTRVPREPGRSPAFIRTDIRVGPAVTRARIFPEAPGRAPEVANKPAGRMEPVPEATKGAGGRGEVGALRSTAEAGELT
jgi:hypothetical protein